MSAPHMILWYPGTCIMFNMTKCTRAKKTCNSSSSDWENNEKNIGDLWEHDDELRLVVRLLQSNDFPWTVANYGTKEVFKAPLVLPILNRDVQGDKVSFFLRDFANRGENCIKRKFSLQFASAMEAESFQFTHNRLLTAYTMKEARQAQKTEEEKVNLAVRVHKKVGEEPQNKKRQFSQISKEEAKVEKVEKEKKEEKEAGEGKTNEYEEILQAFNEGDDHDFLDDCFPETQNDFEDEENM